MTEQRSITGNRLKYLLIKMRMNIQDFSVATQARGDCYKGYFIFCSSFWLSNDYLLSLLEGRKEAERGDQGPSRHFLLDGHTSVSSALAEQLAEVQKRRSN